MAAAILMMNMHGAVMAADKDQTIFRYSEKVPLALMTDPNSQLPWADIWNEFRINSNLGDSYITKFEEFLKKTLPRYTDSFSGEIVFCVLYEPESIFPVTYNLEIRNENKQVIIDKHDSSMCISSQSNTSDVNWLGDLSHMGTVLGDSIIETEDVAREVFPKLVSEFKANAINAAENEADKVEVGQYINCSLMSMQLEHILETTEKRLQKNLMTAIDSYHIEDMVRMSEKLIDVEAQIQHLLEPQKTLMSTKEIATITLAEGFRWIKHSLYGA